jgi:hypothetical protein
MKTQPTMSKDSRPATAESADRRLLALAEWEAVQALCESLVEAGVRRGGPAPQPPPPPDITRL